MLAHELAEKLLEGPNHEVGINYNGEFNAKPRGPFNLTLDKEYVFLDVFGDPLPDSPVVINPNPLDSPFVPVPATRPKGAT